MGRIGENFVNLVNLNQPVSSTLIRQLDPNIDQNVPKNQYMWDSWPPRDQVVRRITAGHMGLLAADLELSGRRITLLGNFNRLMEPLRINTQFTGWFNWISLRNRRFERCHT